MIVADADAVYPRFTAGWLDYAQHCGFATDTARIRSPRDKPRVERTVQCVRGNFFAGEDGGGVRRLLHHTGKDTIMAARYALRRPGAQFR